VQSSPPSLANDGAAIASPNATTAVAITVIKRRVYRAIIASSSQDPQVQDEPTGVRCCQVEGFVC
jgi:hypothetical protein